MKTYLNFSKNSVLSFTHKLKKLTLPRKFFQVSTIVTIGIAYYNKENIIKIIDDFYGRHFQYYNEKNTDFQRLVRYNLEIPIENISDIFDNEKSFNIKEGIFLNIQEMLKNEKQYGLSDFKSLKEFKEHRELKINSFEEMIEKLDKEIHSKNELKHADSQTYNKIVKQEQQLLSEIEEKKGEILNKNKELEGSVNKLNYVRKQLKDKIKKHTEEYSNNLKSSLERIESKYSKELEALRSQYKKEIIPFHLDFEKLEKEEVGKRELLKNLSDMTKIRKQYKDKEIEFIRNKLTSEFDSLILNYNLLKTLNEEHKKISIEYQQSKLEQYNLLNIYFSFDKVLDSCEEKKRDTMESHISEYNDKLYESVTNKIIPQVQANILEFNHKDILKFTGEVINGDELILQQNKKFLSDYYKSKNAEVLIIIKYLMHKQKETPIEEIENLKKYSEQISKNLKELYSYSTIFDDEYTKTLIEKADLFTCKLPSKVEIISSFDEIKKDIFFDIFYYDLNSTSNNSYSNNIFKFLLCGIISKSTDFVLNLYSPFYNTIGENENEIIKQVKAISFIHYFLKNENYLDAYTYFKYLQPHQNKIENLLKKVELMTKNEIVIDLLESHLKH